RGSSYYIVIRISKHGSSTWSVILSPFLGAGARVRRRSNATGQHSLIREEPGFKFRSQATLFQSPRQTYLGKQSTKLPFSAKGTVDLGYL
ncbi:hypothetical protein ACMD2_03244, partial [Ananas comosus]